MEDEKLIALYCAGDQRASTLTEEKYGASCWKIAFRILGNRDYADGVVRDMLLQAGKRIPVKQPQNLEIFLWRITRNLAIAQNSGAGELESVKSEISDWLPYDPSSNQTILGKELYHAINDFLTNLPDVDRKIFVRRYWYFCTASEISQEYALPTAKVGAILRRIGRELRSFLETQGVHSLDPIHFLQSFGHIRESWLIDIEPKKNVAPWMKWTAIGACICCVAILGFIGLRHLIPSSPDHNSPASTKPSNTVSVPVSSGVTTSTATTEVTGTKETEKTTDPPSESTSPTEVAASIRDTAVYQKILDAKNSDQADETVMEAFAQWITDNENADDFLKTYDDQWELESWAGGSFSLTCYSPLDDNHKRLYCSVHYESGEVVLGGQGDLRYTDVPREEISGLVYGARDEIGVSDSLKEEFIDFILYSDWFASSTIKTDHKTEWYFDKKSPFLSSSEEYITLFVKILDDDPNVTSYDLCSLYYNGSKIIDGLRDSLITESP